jgi:hypothetical protein
MFHLAGVPTYIVAEPGAHRVQSRRAASAPVPLQDLGAAPRGIMWLSNATLVSCVKNFPTSVLAQVVPIAEKRRS